MKPPSYFQRIESAARSRWDQLEADPELAGPWHQLFRQVQSPRHVLSELLQNADDAGAQKASVLIEGDDLVFVHDGEDFKEEHFQSLCRFGYSNKRTLHTIGFRGMGFKSTFSLGSRVRLLTPTLSVAFDSVRFTQPVWIQPPRIEKKATEIRVSIEDKNRRKEILRNLQDWLDNPTSVLFFRSLRKLSINEQDIHWKQVGNGPVSDSEWIKNAGSESGPLLLVKSSEEAFPDECIEEIRKERNVPDGEVFDIPPCRIEIVLGGDGRLFVVLPTEVHTGLPFSCNAPFIQDPARVKIKDPSTCPTNRWLLERAGRLAADTLHKWVGNSDLPEEERARAYELIPPQTFESASLAGQVTHVVANGMILTLKMTRMLLTADGNLAYFQNVFALPKEVADVWPPKVTASLFGGDELNQMLSLYINGQCQRSLTHWGLIREISQDNVVETLRKHYPPAPQRYEQLAKLWQYCVGEFRRNYLNWSGKRLRIFPINGSKTLVDMTGLVRLGRERHLSSEEDWTFLMQHLSVLKKGWVRFVNELDGIEHPLRHEWIEACETILNAAGLSAASDTDAVIAGVVEHFEDTSDPTRADRVRLTHIIAALGANAPTNFRYFTCDGVATAVDQYVLHSGAEMYRALAPDDWWEAHALDETYHVSMQSCTAEQWQRWNKSKASRLLGFFPLEERNRLITGGHAVSKRLAEKGGKGALVRQYSTQQFLLSESDFGQELLNHWESMTASDPAIWATLLEGVFMQGKSYWEGALEVDVWHRATTGNTKSAYHEDDLVPDWILRFREVPCLRDVKGILRKPAEMLCRTSETEGLLDVEPFVAHDLDTPDSRKLLKLLGVQDKPHGPESVLNRLRALRKAAKPPPEEVDKWYRRLDSLYASASTAHAQIIEDAFENETLILTESGVWESSEGVFISLAADGLPDTPIIRASVAELSLWRKIGVADRPSLERILDWLCSLPAGGRLEPEQLRRVKQQLGSYPQDVWTEVGCWLNLLGEWVEVDALKYSLAMHTLVPHKNLFDAVRRQTADFQMLSTDRVEQAPFSDISSLSSVLELRVASDLERIGKPSNKTWMSTLGSHLSRVAGDGVELERVRKEGMRLAKTRWQAVEKVHVSAYLAGTPVGPPFVENAVWEGKTLYVSDLPVAKLANAIANALGKPFDSASFKEAIKFCIDRDPTFISEFMESTFELREEGFEFDEPGEAEQSVELEEDPPDEEPLGKNAIAEEPPESQPAPSPVAPSTPRPSQPAKPPKPPMPTMMERFLKSARAKIEPNPGGVFAWVQRDAEGLPIRYYLDIEQCFGEESPLELEAPAWGLLTEKPDLYSLILLNESRDPVEVTGQKLTQMLEREEIALHPAKYRITKESE